MKVIFKPRQLVQAKEMIKEIHSHSKRSINEMMNYKELRKMLNKIVNLKESQVRRYALTLTNEEIYILCVYAPRNQFQIKMDNVYTIIEERVNEEGFEYFYTQWQHHYLNHSCTDLLKCISQKQKERYPFLAKYHFTPGQLAAWVEADSIAYEVVKSCMELEDEKLSAFEQKLAYFKIDPHFELAQQCKNVFYTLCSGKDYLALDEIKLVQILNSFTQAEIKLFVQNFVSKLTLKQLEKYFQVASRIQQYTGHYKTEQYMLFFKDMDEVIEEKYRTWQNYLQLYKVFRNDQRSIFWKRYALSKNCSFSYNPKLDVIFLDFQSHIFTEFRQVGPIYLFEKQYFESQLMGGFLKFDSATKLKSWLFEGYNKKGLNILERVSHQGGWEYKVDAIIRRYKIV